MNRLQLRESVRRKLDEPQTASEQVFWSDEELNDYLNEAYYYYWEMMLDATYQGCLLETFLNVLGGQAEVALPADYHTARLVEWVAQSGTIPLWWDERFEAPNYTAGVSFDGIALLPSVRFSRNNLILEPTPSDTINNVIKFTYYFIPPRMTDDTDEPDLAFKDFYQDLIVYQAVVLAKAKEEAIGQGGADLGAWGQVMERREQKFKESIKRPTTQRILVKPFICGINYY